MSNINLSGKLHLIINGYLLKKCADNMNYWILAGIIFSVLASISTGIGIVKQQKQDLVKDHQIKKFHEDSQKRQLEIIDINKDNLTETVKIKSKVDNHDTSTKKILSETKKNIEKTIRPDILLIDVGTDKTREKYIFKVKNYGNTTAETVELNLDYSVPGGKGIILRQRQIPKDEIRFFESDILPHYSLLSNDSNEGTIKWKNEYDQYIEKFNNGERSLIVRIELNFFWDENKSETHKYFLIHSQDGIILDKE